MRLQCTCTLEEHVAIMVPCWFMPIQDTSCWWALIRISVAAFSGDTVATKSCMQNNRVIQYLFLHYIIPLYVLLSIDIYSVSIS